MVKQAKKNNKEVKLNSKQLKEILEVVIKQNKSNQETYGFTPTSVIIEGMHGLGKTSVPKQLAKELGIQIVELDLQNMEETGDLLGVPYQEYYMCGLVDEVVEKRLPNGQSIKINDKIEKCIWVPKESIESMKLLGYHLTDKAPRMAMAIPEWIHGVQENGILLIDDFTRANSMFQQAIMTIFLEQKTMTWTLPKGWTVIGTSNPSNSDNHCYNVEELDSAQEDRFFKFQLEFDVKEWAHWAYKHGIDDQYIQFIIDYPSLVNDENSPRGISKLFETIKGLDYANNKEYIITLAEARCGYAFALQLMEALKIRKTEIPTAEWIFNEKTTIAELRQRLVEVCGEKNTNNYRPDVSWIVITRVKEWMMQQKKATSFQLGRFKDLICNTCINDNQAYQIAKKAINESKAFENLLEDLDVLNLLKKA